MIAPASPWLTGLRYRAARATLPKSGRTWNIVLHSLFGRVVWMILTLILLAAIGVVLIAERSAEHLILATVALGFGTAALLFVVADFERAILLSSILAAAIFGASSVKY